MSDRENPTRRPLHTESAGARTEGAPPLCAAVGERTETGPDELLAQSHRRDPDLRARTFTAMGDVRDVNLVPRLLAGLGDGDFVARAAAARALSQFGELIVPVVDAAATTSDDPAVRATAMLCLERMEPHRAPPPPIARRGASLSPSLSEVRMQAELFDLCNALQPVSACVAAMRETGSATVSSEVGDGLAACELTLAGLFQRVRACVEAMGRDGDAPSEAEHPRFVHDAANYLASMWGLAEGLAADLASGAPSLRAKADAAREALRDAGRVHAEMRARARVGGAPLDLAAWVKRLRWSLRRFADGSPVRSAVSLSSRGVTAVHCDILTLERAVDAVLTRAVAHTTNGSIVLDARVEGAVLTVDVRDTGPVAEADALTSAAEALRRVEGSLAVVTDAVRGTHVTLRLPCTPVETRPAR